LQRTGLPADIALAFADAESELGRRGWTSSESVVRMTVTKGAPGATIEVRPPATPATGCRAWVAVGRGVHLSRAEWPPTASVTERLTQRFVTPTVACGGSRSFAGALYLADPENDGGEVWFRPVHPGPGGPTLPTSDPRPPLAFAMRVVPESEATLPAPIAESVATAR